MKNNREQNSGIALLFTLILVAIFFILGMAFMSKANFSARMAGNLQESEEARFAANLALENVKATLRQGLGNNLRYPELDDYGYTIPIVESRVIKDEGTPEDTSNDSLYSSQRAFYGNQSDDSYEYALTSKPGRFGEQEGAGHYVDLLYNEYGTMFKTAETTNVRKWSSAYFNVVLDPTWDASASDPRRNGYRFAYYVMSKNGLLDINTTKQRQDINAGNTFTEMISDENAATANVIDSYPNYDLSKVWENCNHNPVTSPIYTFDELFGRKELDGTVTKSHPVSLSGANPDFATYDEGDTGSTKTGKMYHPYRANTDYQEGVPHGSNYGSYADGFHDEEYSYKHVTMPFSTAHSYPAFSNPSGSSFEQSGTYYVEDGTIAGQTLAYSRFDLTKIDNSTNISSGILDNIPYLKRWKDSSDASVKLQANVVAANIKDYIDADLIPTTNYTPGAGVTATTYMGNERVPYLNEIEFDFYHPDTADSYLMAKAELVWLYGDFPTGGFNNYKVNLKVTVEYTRSDTGATVIDDIEMELLEGDPIKNHTAPDEHRNYFLTNMTSYNLNTQAIYSTNTISAPPAGVGAFTCDNLKITKAVMELKNGSDQIVDVAELPATLEVNTNGSNGGVHVMSYQCVDPRNNTHATTTYWDPVDSAFDVVNNWDVPNLSKTNAANNYWYFNTNTAFCFYKATWQFSGAASELSTLGGSNRTVIQNNYKGYPRADFERATPNYLVLYTGAVDTGNYVTTIDPTRLSNRYMPEDGGIKHPVELGMISRGVPHQTLNLTEYNLCDSNDLANANNTLEKASFARSFEDIGTGSYQPYILYDPTNLTTNGSSSAKNTCNGGDREILDDVFVPASTAGSLSNIELDKRIYGQLNINTFRVGAMKLLLLSQSVPSRSGYDKAPDEVVVEENPNSNAVSDFSAEAKISSPTVISDGRYNSDINGGISSAPEEYQAFGALDPYRDLDQFRFHPKWTYDERKPISVKNAPNDPMRWGSKRWGSTLSHDYGPGGDLNDREREMLLMKTKDFVTTRYTLYAGVVVGESMQFRRADGTKPDDWLEFDEVHNDGKSSAGTQIYANRGKVWGKTISQKKFRVELAYDHFLDKVVVLSYKYMGKTE